ncbi:hypothetical protein HU200_053893 [Digitaria exilis]|uniref:Uncharacterized protein n=1 Tax=Digitaria exilis TaxID=1010633 RepID=A0A835AM33_9POAL|nr:hypothetical protein HU200_053893 [Digitaria exilis]
MRSVLNLLLK